MEDGGDSTNGSPSVASAAAALSSPSASLSSIPSTATVSTPVPQRPPRHTYEYVQHYYRSMHGTVRMASVESGVSDSNRYGIVKEKLGPDFLPPQIRSLPLSLIPLVSGVLSLFSLTLIPLFHVSSSLHTSIHLFLPLTHTVTTPSNGTNSAPTTTRGGRP